MGITFKTTFDPEKKKRQILDAIPKRLDRALQKCAREIIKRTQSGQEIEGGAFKPYCKEYRDWKNGGGTDASESWTNFMTAVGGRTKSPKPRKGKEHKAGAGDTVNLTLSGRMLQAITHTVEVHGNKIIGKIFFQPNTEQTGKRVITAADKARWNNPKRPFFGLSKSQKKYILDQLKSK